MAPEIGFPVSIAKLDTVQANPIRILLRDYKHLKRVDRKVRYNIPHFINTSREDGDHWGNEGQDCELIR